MVKSQKKLPQVGIIMGSQSDLRVMIKAADILDEFKIDYELTVVSAHRTPDWMFRYAKSAVKRGLKVIIAGAGGSAHLPGMIASITTLPVIGVPIRSENSLDGWDSILSILQMPNGIPVATVAVNGAANAGILATQMIAVENSLVQKRLMNYKMQLRKKVELQIKDIQTKGFRSLVESLPL